MTMAFDGARRPVLTPSTTAATLWRRDERLILLVGGACLGAVAGFFLTLWAGRVDIWMLALIAAPVLALDLHLTGRTLTEALERRAFGCATTCGLHAVAVIAWPLSALAAPLSPVAFWIAPVLALTALVLFASCWSSDGRALYRMSAQGALVAALMAQQGLFVMLGA